jgi:branched-chain amino acid transport system ATP-binding protein
MLALENISGGYGSLPVIEDVSLDVKQGETKALIGANKAGKSTAFRLITGLLKPRSGKITFNGIDITGLTPGEIVNLGIVLVPEGRRLFTDMTVLENLLVASYFRRAKEQRASSFKLVYELFPVLANRSKQIAATLSGGEQQQLAVARGLMSRPEVLMLDEPTIGLDPSARRSIMKAISELSKRNVGVIIAEQNMIQTLKICDYTYIMAEGQIVLQGESKRILDDLAKEEMPGILKRLIS